MLAALLAVAAYGLVLTACGGGSAHAQNPDSRASYATLVGAGDHLLGQGNVGAAQQLFADAIRKAPHSPVAYYDLGVAYQREGEFRQAGRNYFHAIAEDRDYVPALYNEAGLLSARNAPLAIFYYRRIIQLRPDASTAYLNLGLLELATKPLHPEAMRDLARAVKLEPSLVAQVLVPLRSQLRSTKSR